MARVNIFGAPTSPTKLDPISVDISILMKETLSPQAQSAFLAAYARRELATAIEKNKQALKKVPEYETFVDDRRSSVFESVKSPNGKIVIEFDLRLQQEMFAWIGEELVQHSPVGPPPAPAYSASHVFFADGQQIEPGGVVPPASIYMFANTVPYARKIERGESAQAPDGVYQAVASLAQARFGKVAKIRFAYVGLAGLGGERQPAIVITAR